MKHVDLEKPTSCLDQGYFVWTQRECKPNKNLVDEYRKCSNRESLQATEKLRDSEEKCGANAIAWSNDMEGHARKCLERYCDLANKDIEQLYKVSAPVETDFGQTDFGQS